MPHFLYVRYPCTIEPMVMRTQLENFLAWCETEQGCKLATLQRYQAKMLFFLDWAKAQRITTFKKLRKAHLNRYLKFLAKQCRGIALAHATQNTYVSPLRQFIAYAHAQGLTKLVAPDVPRQPQKSHMGVILTAQELTAFCTPLQAQSLAAARDQVLIEVLVATDLRASEVRALNWQDVDLDGTTPCIVLPNRENYTPISHQAYYWLKRYHTLRADAGAAVFVSFDRAHLYHRLSVRGIERILEGRAKEVGLAKRITPTLLRTTFLAM